MRMRRTLLDLDVRHPRVTIRPRRMADTGVRRDGHVGGDVRRSRGRRGGHRRRPRLVPRSGRLLARRVRSGGMLGRWRRRSGRSGDRAGHSTSLPTRIETLTWERSPALRWQLLAALDVAGREIDTDPDDVATAMQRALMLRHTVERAATSIIDLYGRAMGPRPLIQDAEIVRRVSELQLYIRQHHDEHDLESIGRSLRDPDGLDPHTFGCRGGTPIRRAASSQPTRFRPRSTPTSPTPARRRRSGWRESASTTADIGR